MGPFALVLAIALCSQGPKAAPGRIEGRIVDTLCAVVADAEVVAFVRGREIARGRSDGSGAFVLADLPHEVLLVRARGQGLAFAVARVDLTGDDFAAPRLQCFASRTLTGRVLGDGKPVAGAQVIAQPDDLPEFVDAPPCAVTGADGSYRLEGVVIGPARVRVWGPGLPLAEQASQGPGDATVDFALSARTARELVVRVRGASPAQLAATRVLLTAADGAPMAMPPGLASGMPDAEGNVHFLGWPAGLVNTHVVVAVPDAITEPWRCAADGGGGRWLSPPLSRSPVREVEFTVAPTASRLLRGVVRDPEGKLLAHRQLLLRPLDDAPWSFAVVRGETGDDGAFALVCPVSEGEPFALRLVDEQWVVQQRDDGRGSAWFVDKCDPSVFLEVRAVPALSLHTVLRAPDGTPIGGAEVTVLASDGSSHRVVLGSGTSRSDGSVDIEGLNAQQFTYEVAFVASPQWIAPQAAIDDPSKLGADLTSRMVRAGAIAGRVLNGRSPLPGSRVQFGKRVTVADAEGRFRFDGVPEGEAQLTAPGRQRRIQVRAGEEVTVELR